VEIDRLGGAGLFDRASIWVATLRTDLSRRLAEQLGPERGAFAAAITTGDRAGVREETMQALRDSNLAHLLAISGLHMGLLTGLVFVIVRLGLALAGRASLVWNAKKIAAAAAIGAGLCYLAVSGASIATQRAFIMVTVMFGAVLLDRPALTLRALAAAALIILVLRPESLLDAGFQLSFAATTALIAVYEALRDRFRHSASRRKGVGMTILRYVGGLLLTSFIAGMATAPYGAFHFNRMSTVGLLANLGAVPVMGLWIMPSVIAAAVLAPFGLEGLAFTVMAAGIDQVLWVAHATASIEGAARLVPAGPTVALALISFGGLWLCLWRSRLRLLGIVPIALALVLWATNPRPDVLIAPRAGLIGVLSQDGRVLDSPRRERFAAETWLRKDGDPNTPIEAAARVGFVHARREATYELSNGWTIRALFGRKLDREMLNDLCREKVLIVAPAVRKRPEGDCRFLGRLRLRSAVAIYQEGERLRFQMGFRPRFRRLWSTPRN
jgi:competence protein ComEC